MTTKNEDLVQILQWADSDTLDLVQTLLGDEMYRRATAEVGSREHSLNRLAAVIKGKHAGRDSSECETGHTADYTRKPPVERANNLGNYQNDQHLDRLTPREESRVEAALRIGAEQEKDPYRTGTAMEQDPRHPESLSREGSGDDRHVFASGASSSGRKPNYIGTMPLFAYERFARHREFGDNKHGVDNYLKGCRDKEFILDRINHGIEHLMNLSNQVKMGGTGNWNPGHDDAAAVMCAGMFVMCYQQAMGEVECRYPRKTGVMTNTPAPGDARDGFGND